MSYEFFPIGTASTPYPEKFSIPRQPGLVTSDQSYIELQGDANREEILRGLENFSHIWVVFVFHHAMRDNWKPMVRPPRLGGNEKVGVFASRSPFRPNPIGLSVLKLKGISSHQGRWRIHIEGADLLNGTPILDIKPYLPYADSLSNAQGGFATAAPERLPVIFSATAEPQLQKAAGDFIQLRQLIIDVLGQQPQPAYHSDKQKRQYGISLYTLNIRWQYSQMEQGFDTAAPGAFEPCIEVTEITQID
ncbi:MAG: tRNA (N6-threonylcarbamoyladenosine(37)-N6)-methyltransferase TrmO [Candidatus Pelagadaptatus aseana]|uniref:tRNA (N6-threonylcarbamoyladenosine(37)-N6)-methyltransferase TrmO n=1 Tax=Candidatus Pelagadaptatus aseana TaxID=3120508 RepID=UPI0039B2F790